MTRRKKQSSARPRSAAFLAAAVLGALLSPSLSSAPASAAAAAAVTTTAPGQVDTTFGGGFAKYHLTDLDDAATAVAVQPDGAVVVVGKMGEEVFDPYTPASMFVARFTAAGSLDPTFGTNGRVVLGAPGAPGEGYAVAVQPDGRIVVGGVLSTGSVMVRLMPSGGLDPTFQGGIVPALVPPLAIALRSDGKILYTGGPSVGRLNPDGTNDTGFGVNGLTPPPPEFRGDQVAYRSIAQYADGRIVVGGSWNGASFSLNAVPEYARVARFTPAGQPDTSFGDAGLVSTNLDNEFSDSGTTISGIAVQTDGKIVAVGENYTEWGANTPIHYVAQHDALVLRYLVDGRLDSSFAADGAVISHLTSQPNPAISQPGWPQPFSVFSPDAGSAAKAVALSADGSILVAGWSRATGKRTLVLRYSPAGLLDTTFARDGALSVDVPQLESEATAMAMQPDGSLIVAGSTRIPGDNVKGHYTDLLIGRVTAQPGAGTLWDWGWNGAGQLGDGTAVDRHSPVQVPGLTKMVAVSASAFHTLALRSDGTVWAWGLNVFGEIGDGTKQTRLRPVQVPGLTGVVAIAAGGAHSMALRGDGTVWTWGWNGLGELGDGTIVEHLTPRVVPGLSGIIGISAGVYHSLAIREDGRALGWGLNSVGQVGDRTTIDRHSPVLVPQAGSNYTHQAVAAGALHSLATHSLGALEAWGWNGTSQLAVGGPPFSPEPVTVEAQRVIAASAGWYHSLVLIADGTVHAGGWNAVGQLGDGQTGDHRWDLVPGLTSIDAVGAGGAHSLALTHDGRLMAWGWNYYGQLGLGSTADQHSPVVVPSLTNVSAISAGYLHTVVVRA